tara:strand:- start:80 stop:448 length:369 start_codon:yes stop_codon:yes gene_type:complete
MHFIIIVLLIIAYFSKSEEEGRYKQKLKKQQERKKNKELGKQQELLKQQERKKEIDDIKRAKPEMEKAYIKNISSIRQMMKDQKNNPSKSKQKDIYSVFRETNKIARKYGFKEVTLDNYNRI